MLLSERGSGLLVAEQAAAPRQIREALKRIHPDLALGCEIDARHQCYVWNVRLRQGDRPAVWLFDWREELGNPHSKPRPLSMAIVEEARDAQLGSRRPLIDPLAHNDAITEANDRDFAAAAEDARHERARHPGRISPPKPSVRLRMAKDKMRARGLNV